MIATARILPRAALCAVLLLVPAAPAAAASVAFGSEGDFEYALRDGKGQGTNTFRSSRHSWREIERFLDAQDGPALWFAIDGRSYVVRDPALIAQARGIVRPMAELGAKQGDLGRQQGELGRAQGRLGRRQGELGRRLGSLAASAAWSGESRSDRAELRRLEDEMEDLARRQEELGRKQAAASKKANGALRRLADRALEAGKARATRI